MSKKRVSVTLNMARLVVSISQIADPLGFHLWALQGMVSKRSEQHLREAECLVNLGQASRRPQKGN